MTTQCTSTVLMIRPKHFGFNDETATDNVFQEDPGDLKSVDVEKRAVEEFDAMVNTLRTNNVEVLVIEDTDTPVKPDAVFPNNWVSFHDNGAVITYAMNSEKRRLERRDDVVEQVMEMYGFDRRYSLEQYENKGHFLEGTGSMVLDRKNAVVYACISERTNPLLLDKFCALTGYQRVVFSASSKDGTPVYHTNVMMSLGDQFAVVCMEAIEQEKDRAQIEYNMSQTGRILIPITLDQLHAFAGNMLQLVDQSGKPLIVLSGRALHSLDADQLEALREQGKLVHCDIPTIETYGGGSTRCMMAEIFKPLQ